MNTHGVNDKTTYTWMQTGSNTEIEYSADEWVVLPIEDIANALANTCRYNGHCSRYYSVAEHSVLMSRLVPQELQLAALLHDASEAYVGDMPTGLKRFMGLSFKDLEHKAHEAVARGYGVSVEMQEHPEIKKLDKQMLGEEGRVLMPPHVFWEQFPDKLDVTIEGWQPQEAREKFLARFYELTK